ncbi:MAG: hypothetical protein SH868_18695 [Bythopirellula sp.]|nr:hypothetical protein [Bythopirellula sp.]
MNETACMKCGSTEIIPDVRIIDHGPALLDLSATVYTNPEAYIFKGAISHRLQARVCGLCGYTEFYVSNPQALLTAAKGVASKAAGSGTR